MKHIPTLFSTEMVQAILEDRKKMTRRTKGLDQYNNPDDKPIDDDNPGRWFYAGMKDGILHMECMDTFESFETKAPYSIGDILWVRESFTVEMMRYRYKADDYITDEEKAENIKPKWRPSIHMPKEACRIFLKVTDVRCERLHEITEQDAVDEGVEVNTPVGYKNYLVDGDYFSTAKYSFKSLWVKINGKVSLDANPYVWIISFERCDRPSDFLNQINK